MRLDKAGTAACFTAISHYRPSENATADLVDTLRSTVIPRAGHGTDLRAEVGGGTTADEDLASTTSAKLPLQIMALIALSFALLILGFRTVVIPAQAAVANVFSIAAACGVLTAIFRFGWLSRLFELTGSVPIVSYVPPLMFGLPVVDEVFRPARSRIRSRRRGRHPLRHPRIGDMCTRVTAAHIMVFVFSSFGSSATRPSGSSGSALLSR
jgi:RND superfamily putative drug exporter